MSLQNQRLPRRVARRGEPILKGGPLHDLPFSYAPGGARFLGRRRFQLASEVDSLERCRAPSVAERIGSQSPVTYSPASDSSRHGAIMDDRQALSARVKAAFEGCYEGPRAAALSGVPVSTVYLWARSGIVEPSVSPTRIKLWSYADLMALRIVYWLRHPKKGRGSEIAASPMPLVREALAELERREARHLGRQR